MPRQNTVGDDTSVLKRIPKSLLQSVSALIKLHRGNVGCPHLYACIAMSSIYSVFERKTGAPPLYQPHLKEIDLYLKRLSMALMELHTAQKLRLDDKYNAYLDFIDDMTAVLEDTFSDTAIFRQLAAGVETIEAIESYLKRCGVSIK